MSALKHLLKRFSPQLLQLNFTKLDSWPVQKGQYICLLQNWTFTSLLSQKRWAAVLSPGHSPYSITFDISIALLTNAPQPSPLPPFFHLRLQLHSSYTNASQPTCASFITIAFSSFFSTSRPHLLPPLPLLRVFHFVFSFLPCLIPFFL